MNLVLSAGLLMFLWMMRWVILAAISMITVHEIGYQHEMWGIPARLGEVSNLQIANTNNYYEMRPYVSGVFTNNSDKNITHASIKVVYYRCAVGLRVTDYDNDCAEISPRTAVQEMRLEGIKVKPHTSVNFKLIDTFTHMGYNEIVQMWSDPAYNIYYIGKVTRMIE